VVNVRLWFVCICKLVEESVLGVDIKDEGRKNKQTMRTKVQKRKKKKTGKDHLIFIFLVMRGKEGNGKEKKKDSSQQICFYLQHKVLIDFSLS